MNKYIVKTEELQWINVKYLIEAESEEEARERIENLEGGEILDEDYDCVDQITVTSVEKIND